MNIEIMSAEEIVQWYKPKTDTEAVIVEAIREYIKKQEELQSVIEGMGIDYQQLEKEYEYAQGEIYDLKKECNSKSLDNARLRDAIRNFVSGLESELLL